MRPQLLAIAALSAMALLGNACSKSEPKAIAPPPTEPAKAPPAKVEIPALEPRDWLIVEDTEYIPVIDDLTAKLNASKKAFVAKDFKTASTELRAAADLLDKEAVGASRRDKVQVSEAAKTLRAMARPLEGGKAPQAKVLEAALAKAHDADLIRDWLVADATTWYPYVDEPNAHFQAAHESFVNKEYKKAAEEIRKGAAFVRIEEGSAAAEARAGLSTSEHDLEGLARHVEQGAIKDVKDLDNAFARADHALARSHQLKATEALGRREAGKVEHELKAGAKHVEDAATWAGTEAQEAAAAAVRNSRVLCSKLASGSGYAVEEVGKAIDDLGKALEHMGQTVRPAN